MDKEFLKKVVDVLKKNSFVYSLEGYISRGLYFVQEIFIYDCEDKKKLKDIFDKEVLENVKISESYAWYLGERRKSMLLKLKKHIELAIPEFEAMQTNNHAA